MPSPAAALAQAAAQTDWVRLPELVRRRAEMLLRDTIAVIAGGVAHPSFAPIVSAHLRSSQGPCTVPGQASGAAPVTAATLNGGATTVLQLQDGHRVARGHPASHAVPVLLALAEESGAGAQQFLTSLVAGYEVAARVGMSLGGMHEALHDAGTWATIGAAAAGAHFLSGANPEIIAHAIDGAASVALFPYRHSSVRGASIHHLYIGLGAAAALNTALGVQAGLRSVPGTLESFFGPRAGHKFDAALLTHGIDANGGWSTYEILNGYVKWHPVCGHHTSAMDAMTRVMAHDGVSANNVTAVDVATYAAALDYNVATPANDLAARFSLPAAMASILVGGNAYRTNIEFEDQRIQALMARVRVRHDTALDADYPSARPARVSVTLAGGRTISETVMTPYGDGAHALSDADFSRKTQALLTTQFGVDGTAKVSAALDAYIAGGPIGILSAALRQTSK